MTSHTTEQFRKLLAQLPKEIQKQAKEAYLQFKNDPYHPGLRFKRVTTNLRSPHLKRLSGIRHTTGQ